MLFAFELFNAGPYQGPFLILDNFHPPTAPLLDRPTASLEPDPPRLAEPFYNREARIEVWCLPFSGAATPLSNHLG